MRYKGKALHFSEQHVKMLGAKHQGKGFDAIFGMHVKTRISGAGGVHCFIAGGHGVLVSLIS